MMDSVFPGQRRCVHRSEVKPPSAERSEVIIEPGSSACLQNLLRMNLQP